MAQAISDFPTAGSEAERPPLGALLTGRGLISEARLEEALAEGVATGDRLGEVLVRRGWVTEDDVAKLLAEQWQLGYVERASIFFDADALGRMSREEAQRLEALPTRVQDGHVVVAVAEPTEERLRALRQVIGDETVVVVVPKTALDAGLRSELLSSRASEPTATPPIEQAPTPVAKPPELAVVPTHEPQADVAALVSALEAAAAEAAALQAGTAALAGRLARLVDDAAAAASRVTASTTSAADQAKIERLEQQLAQRTDVTESLKEQLAGLTRTLEDYH